MESSYLSPSTASFSPLALPGMGIASGLDLRRDSNQNIVLNPGYGYTSLGHLIQVPALMSFYFYEILKPETDQAILDYFHCSTAWELFEKSDNNDTRFALHPRRPEDQRKTPFLDDKVMAVWKQDETLRYFLLQRQEVAKATFQRPLDFKLLKAHEAAEKGFDLWANKIDTPSQQDPSIGISDYTITNALHPVYELPVLAMPHLGYGHLDAKEMPCDEVYDSLFCSGKLTSFEDLAKAYQLVVDVAIDSLDEAVCQLHTITEDWLSEHSRKFLSKHLCNLQERWKNYKNLFILQGEDAKGNDLPDQSGIQYWYSFLRDLIEAYNETREAALIYHNLVPDTRYTFQHHLYLGTPQEEQVFVYPNPFRTHFRYPVILNEQLPHLERLRFLHWRMTVMIKSFYVPELEWDDTATDSYLSVFRSINSDNPDDITGKINMPIRITPSRGNNEPLGRRAIPFYYDLADHQQSLHWYWDYDATRQNRADQHFSYHSENDNAEIKNERGEVFAGTDKSSYTHRLEVIHPFLFDQRPYSFLRVEGLAGKMGTLRGKDFSIPGLKWKSTDQAEISLNEFITKLQKQYNICFEIEFIEIGSTPGKTKLCGHCIDHLGGTYKGGILIILLAKIPTGMHKIVGDFYSAHSCTCEGKEGGKVGGAAVEKASQPSEKKSAKKGPTK